MTIIHTYSPVTLALNWQSELISHQDERLQIMKELFVDSNVTVNAPAWPMGYGSLDHDNLPILYQPSAMLTFEKQPLPDTVKHCALYCYDNCLAVLHIELNMQSDVDELDDMAITEHVNTLSDTLLKSVLQTLYDQTKYTRLIPVKRYRFYTPKELALLSAKPVWVARMVQCEQSVSESAYTAWLKNIDVASDELWLGSGNHLLRHSDAFDDVHRMMVLSQFHVALASRIEDLLKHTLKKFNASYFETKEYEDVSKTASIHQQRNDHIDYIHLQFSACLSGVQGVRRQLLDQFFSAWKFDEQQTRVESLSKLVQTRLDRMKNEQLAKQSRGIQTLLAFLGALSLVSLVVDLIGLQQATQHDDTYGIFDLLKLLATEHIVSVALLLVIVFTAYFYKNHR